MQLNISIPEPVKRLISLFKQWQQEVLVRVVGLEISPAYIKLIKIDHSKSPYIIESCLIEPVPPGLINKDEIKDYEAVSEIIKEMFAKGGIATTFVALAIPRSLAIIKNITIDARLTVEDIESRAWIEANRLFPELVGDVYLDFSIVGPSEQDPSQLEVTLVACRKDNIKPYLEVLRQAGLTVKMVDINCYALQRALPLLITPEQQKETTALFNMDIDLSTLIVTKNNHMLYSHDQGFAGGRLVALTTKYLQDAGIQPNQVTDALLEDSGYQAILTEGLTSHLRHTVHFFYSSRPNISIKKMILSGDCASIPLIDKFIQREISIETEIADPKDNLKFDPKIADCHCQVKITALIECCGLAISKLDV